MENGSRVPAVSVTMADGRIVRLDEVTDGALVVYTYPRDDTPGCTREAIDFSAAAATFADLGVTVIGLSRDTPASHQRFAAKHALSVDLASDEDGDAVAAFGVWGEKLLYGRRFMGVERATFLFGRDGRLVHVWRRVRVPGHVDAVLEKARSLP